MEAPEAPDNPLRVLIIGDDRLARAGLAAALAEQSGCSVVGQARPDADVAALAERLRVDAVLWDIGRAGTWPETPLPVLPVPVLLLVPPGAPARAWPPQATQGLVSRDLDGAGLVAALRALDAGLTVIDPGLAPGVPGLESSDAPGPIVLLEPLTPRELEVLRCLAAGVSNRLIADRLRISEHTVRFHLNAIFSKLGAHTRTEAVSRGLRLGLITL